MYSENRSKNIASKNSKSFQMKIEDVILICQKFYMKTSRWHSIYELCKGSDGKRSAK